METLFDRLVENSTKEIQRKENDYVGPDGLLYCGNCHTPKQCKIEFLGQIRTPMCLCRCEKQKMTDEEEEAKKAIAEKEIREMRETGFFDSDMMNWTFANDDLENEKLTKTAKKYVENFERFLKDGQGLLFFGGVGTGKTYAACEIANALIDKHQACLVTNFTRILNTLQSVSDKQGYLDGLNKYKLLVIDDLAAERSTEYAKEQVYSLIDARYRAKLPMIITTNLSRDEIKSPKLEEDKRIFDRIIERCYPIEVSGGSRRKKKFRDGHETIKEILGL